jgi:hypothetical protein
MPSKEDNEFTRFFEGDRVEICVGGDFVEGKVLEELAHPNPAKVVEYLVTFEHKGRTYKWQFPDYRLERK